MRKQLILILIMICMQATIHADGTSLTDKIEQLNKESIKFLGNSLNALAYLMDTSSQSFMPLSYLEESGQIEYIRELEKAGYVKVTFIQKLPDGREFREMMLNLQPLKLGVEAQNSLMAQNITGSSCQC